MFTILFLTSCKKDIIVLNKNYIPVLNFPKSDTLQFKDIFDYKYGVPNSMKLIDSSLLIFNENHNVDYFFYNYSIKKDTIISKFLKKGRGPNEALGASVFGISDNKLWVKDVTIRKLLIADIKKVISSDSRFMFDEYSLKKYNYRMDFVNDNRFLTVGQKESLFKIQELDLKSEKIIGEFGEFEVIPDNIPLDACKDACKSFIYVKSDNSKVVLPYLYTDIVEIYDLNSKKHVAIQGPDFFDIVFSVGKRGKMNYMKKTKKTKKAFIHGDVTAKYIYLLYSGGLRSNPKHSLGKFIFVYDWEGNPIRKINLDRYVQTFTVSKDDKWLYSFDMETGQILKGNTNYNKKQ